MRKRVRQHFETGLRAQIAGDHLTAQHEYARALEDDRNNPDVTVNAATLLGTDGRLQIAEVMAERATLLVPNSYKAWHNLGYTLGLAGKYDQAIDALRKALTIEERHESLYALGICLYSAGRWDEALKVYDRALELKPDDVPTIDDRSNVCLSMGDYKQGFIDNKIRWTCAAAHPYMHNPTPEWKGENLTGKSIAILHEQGYGDSIQFMRFVPWLKTKCGAARTIISMRQTAIGLFKLSGLADKVVGVHDIGDENPDMKVPMLTVPAYIGLSVDNIPGEPYLKAPLRRPLLPKTPGKMKIGFVWGGIPMYAADQWRSLPTPLVLLPLIRALADKALFYSLQQDDRRAQLWQSGLNLLVTDLGDHLKDWLDTAALVNEMDMIVSVDTAVAHLAGAMGKRVATLIPQASCWRWMDHSTTTTPWYPTMRLYRQHKQGDWSVPIADLIRDLL